MNLATVKDVKNINTTGWDEAMVGVFGRVVYSWKSRYTVTGNLRFDGSSVLVRISLGIFPFCFCCMAYFDELSCVG